MKNISLRSFSVLGVVLMGVSAVTAAVLPNKSDSKSLVNNGSLTAANTLDAGIAVLSCTATAQIGTPCTVTVGTATTQSGQVNSTVDGIQTVNNTTTV
jgi:hypothetical protein